MGYLSLGNVTATSLNPEGLKIDRINSTSTLFCTGAAIDHLRLQKCMASVACSNLGGHFGERLGRLRRELNILHHSSLIQGWEINMVRDSKGLN